MDTKPLPGSDWATRQLLPKQPWHPPAETALLLAGWEARLVLVAASPQQAPASARGLEDWDGDGVPHVHDRNNPRVIRS